MKDCRDVEPLKAPYVDGEAVPADRVAVDTHLQKCGRCRTDVAAEQAAHEALAARREELKTLAPAGLKARCAAQRAARAAGVPSDAPAAVPLYRRWVPMSVAATLFLVVAGVFGFGLTGKAEALAFQMTLDHMGCTRSARASEAGAIATGQHWGERYGWPLRLAPSSQQAALTLKGLRRCFVTDGRVAHLIYDWHGEPLSVFVLPEEKMHSPAEVEQFGHDAVMWSQNGRTYVVLARAPRRPELDTVVQYVKANVY